ncbi:hypothetical protein Pcinc_023762 [Petrolisthes cinctipes]|uniref:Uncharacterized protein n=1 Tax=Petrolisthes cinctipes TaxID=88211 RepID=A0AAE1KBT9_PETCI|nr:hypothetical protein Pcinc_023762 [Petrolisthes cinctipes]
MELKRLVQNLPVVNDLVPNVVADVSQAVKGVVKSAVEAYGGESYTEIWAEVLTKGKKRKMKKQQKNRLIIESSDNAKATDKKDERASQTASDNQVQLLAFSCGLATKPSGTVSTNRRRGERWNSGASKPVASGRKSGDGVPKVAWHHNAIPATPATPLVPSCIDFRRSLGSASCVEREVLLPGQQLLLHIILPRLCSSTGEDTPVSLQGVGTTRVVAVTGHKPIRLAKETSARGHF